METLLQLKRFWSQKLDRETTKTVEKRRIQPNPFIEDSYVTAPADKVPFDVAPLALARFPGFGVLGL
jgi:hypothetical protein